MSGVLRRKVLQTKLLQFAYVSKVNNSICVGNSDSERYLGIAVYLMNIFGRYEAANYVV